MPAPAVDLLIEVHRALARENRDRRDRAEAAATTLMTTAATLGAVTVAASRSVGRLVTVTEVAVYVALSALVMTFLIAGLSRVGSVVGSSRNPEMKALRGRVEAAIVTLRAPVQDAESGSTETTILDLWRARAQRDWLVSQKQWELVRLSALVLVVAVLALTVAGFWLVGSSPG